MYLHTGANLHPDAICAYERKMFNFYTFCSGILVYCGPFFYYDLVYTDIKSKFYIVFIKMKIRLFIMADQPSK